MSLETVLIVAAALVVLLLLAGLIGTASAMADLVFGPCREAQERQSRRERKAIENLLREPAEPDDGQS